MKHSFSRRLPSLPEIVVTRDGFSFDPRPDVWRIASLAGSANFHFDDLGNLSPETVHCLKLAIVFRLERKSFSHSGSIFGRFRAFYVAEFKRKTAVCSGISLSDITSYRDKLTINTIWYLGLLRLLFNTMEGLGIGICTPEARDYLGDSKIPGNIKGTAIRTRDPEKGMFNDIELQTIQASLNDAYALGRISLEDYVIGWLFLAYGSRPIQFSQLKENDLVVSEGDGERFYALRMPMAKGRGTKYRTEFKVRYCAKQLGKLLERLIEANERRRSELGIDVKDPPLLSGETEGDIADFGHHVNSQTIARRFSSMMRRITNLKANADRFRKTLGQRAADAGKDIYEIADLLGHRDTQQVKVYTESTLAMTGRLDRAMAMEMAVLAQAFAGVLVEREAERRGRASRLYERSLPGMSDRAIGNCGLMSFCGQSIPIACYTCRHFEPWLDGPHEAFLALLVEDRERMVSAGYSPKIYAIRDRTILAVAQVIQACTDRLALNTEAGA